MEASLCLSFPKAHVTPGARGSEILGGSQLVIIVGIVCLTVLLLPVLILIVRRTHRYERYRLLSPEGAERDRALLPRSQEEAFGNGGVVPDVTLDVICTVAPTVWLPKDASWASVFYKDDPPVYKVSSKEIKVKGVNLQPERSWAVRRPRSVGFELPATQASYGSGGLGGRQWLRWKRCLPMMTGCV